MSHTKLNPLKMVVASITEQATVKKRACPICHSSMQETTANGKPALVCLHDRVCVPN